MNAAPADILLTVSEETLNQRTQLNCEKSMHVCIFKLLHLGQFVNASIDN